MVRFGTPDELSECQAFWQWAQLNSTLRKYLIKHCNEGKRSLAAAGKLLSIGMRPGLPDYQLPLANHQYHGLWVEMKRRNERNRKKRPNQIEWIENLNNRGHLATFAYGWEDAARITTEYMATLPCY